MTELTHCQTLYKSSLRFPFNILPPNSQPLSTKVHSIVCFPTMSTVSRSLSFLLLASLLITLVMARPLRRLNSALSPSYDALHAVAPQGSHQSTKHNKSIAGWRGDHWGIGHCIAAVYAYLASLGGGLNRNSWYFMGVSCKKRRKKKLKKKIQAWIKR